MQYYQIIWKTKKVDDVIVNESENVKNKKI